MHILAATDASEHAREAIEFASQFAAQAGARMTVLGVVEQADRETVTKLALEDVDRLLIERGIEHATRVRHGHAAEQILQEIEENEYDLVVMGARGRTRLTRFLLGSVSFRVLEHAHIPVLVVRQARPRIKKILVTTGAHPRDSEITMRYGAQLARVLGATETLLHVTNPVPQMYTGLDDMDETLPELMQADTKEARALREGAQMMDAQEVEGEVELRRGLVEDEVVRQAIEGDYDLVVCGSSAPAGPIGRLAIGNITRRVIDRTRRPVLVVRGDVEQTEDGD